VHRGRRHPPGAVRDRGVRHRGHGAAGAEPDDPARREHRFHDRVNCRVVADRRTILDLALIDPEPITGHDIQYPPGMHLARVIGENGPHPRIVQCDTEYEFKRADRGNPQLNAFDAAAWGDERLVPTQPVSASATVCDMTITSVRYVCNPDIPAAEGTQNVGS
jgi:hypothetical protein